MAGQVLLSVSAAMWQLIRRHLLQNDVEQAAVIYAHTETSADNGLRLSAGDHYLCRPDDFAIQSDVHISLTDEAQARLIKEAWDRRAALVELHSHVGDMARAGFSPSDLAGLADFVPHVRWRLRGAPYVAIVIAESGFDALVWYGDSKMAVRLDALEVDRQVFSPTNRTIRALQHDIGRNHVR